MTHVPSHCLTTPASTSVNTHPAAFWSHPPALPPSPQNHSNEDIYDKAVSLLENYFDVEDGEVENLAPAVDAAQGEAACCTWAHATAGESAWRG